MATTRRHIRTFAAKDSAGVEYTIEVYQQFISSQTRGGTVESPGIKEYYTSDGDAVNPVEGGDYDVIKRSGGIVRVNAVAPNDF